MTGNLYKVGAVLKIVCPYKPKAHGHLTIAKEVLDSFGSGYSYWCEGNEGAGLWHESFLRPTKLKHLPKKEG